MRYVSCIVAAAALAATVGGCAQERYYGPTRTYYATAPAYYQPSGYYPAYGYSYPARSYDGYGSKYDYYRNYNGSLHPPAENL